MHYMCAEARRNIKKLPYFGKPEPKERNNEKGETEGRKPRTIQQAINARETHSQATPEQNITP